jgi:hypothetical protein
MSDRRVVVQGGGKNLYKIHEYSGKYTAYCVDVGFLSNTNKNIGEARNLEDALTLIKVHSGKEIKEIS